ncbi:hypothetical protein BJ912DRAFT_890029 [Pholiota molesta]|nr:hypothetical protein BJ912DRAFT_890029 [Pholiota molesta]
MDVALPALDETIAQEEKLRMIDEAIEKQSRAIDALRISLLALKSRRNASVPISRLPPEILCNIFSFAQVPGIYSMSRKVELSKWINLTYVCRHWRSVAVNAPSLWVDPPIGNVKWVAEMLRRSKESSLVIKIDCDRMLGMELALGDIHRTRELSIQHISSDTWNVIQGMIPVSAPRLERLCLVGQHAISYYGGVAHSPAPISISEDILREAGPLRQLELTHCALNWISHSHLLCSLTHLKLHRLSHLSQKSTLEFMDIFKIMPNLEVLDLSEAFPAYPTVQHFSQLSKEVHFPHLRTLHIQDSITSEIKAFFRNVTFPPSTMVKIVYYESDSRWREGEDDNDDDDEPKSLDLSEIISGLARSYSKPHPEAVFQSLILRRTSEYDVSDTGVRLNLFTEMVKDFDIFCHCKATPHLELVVECAIERQEFTQLLNDVCTSGMLDDIIQVCLPEKMPNLSSETIANTLGQLSCIHSLVVARDVTRTFLNAVVLGSHVSAADASGSCKISELGLSFHSLTSIFLYYVNFVASHLVERPKHADAISTEQLQDMLMHRCDFGVPIDKLFLHECVRFFAKDKELLREFVVDVDGSPETHSSGDESEEDEQMEEDEEDEYSDSSAEVQDPS